MSLAPSPTVHIQPVTGATEHTPPSNRAFFPALDGIRALAFLMVFFSHYVNFKPGGFGVDIFFVLSGFLITGILYDTRNEENRYSNFYVRRSLRIFPLYYAVILLIVLAWPIFHWQWDWRWLCWPLYAGNWVLIVHRGTIDDSTMQLFNGWLYGRHSAFLLIGHFWSLCVEEQFYLIWPWVVFQVKSRRALIAISTAVVLLCPLLRWVALHRMNAQLIDDGILVHATLFRIDTLMVGAVVALLYRGSSRAALFSSARWSIWIASALAAVAVVAVALHPALLHRHGLYPMLYMVGFTAVAYFSAVLIVSSLVKDSWMYRIFSNPILRWGGRITYGAYIFHDILHPLYTSLAVRLHVPVWVLALATTTLISWLSFRYFESPLLDLKDKLAPSSPSAGKDSKSRPAIA